MNEILHKFYQNFPLFPHNFPKIFSQFFSVAQKQQTKMKKAKAKKLKKLKAKKKKIKKRIKNKNLKNKKI